jgi:deoxycytidine triphosphate deaminase
MIISPQKAYDLGIVTKLLNATKQIGSDGIDLTIKSISRVASPHRPVTLSESKQRTQYLDHTPIIPVSTPGADSSLPRSYFLHPAVYDVTFNEGCALPLGVAATLHLRSTFVRNGCFGVSGLYDSGFTSTNCGMLLHVNYTIAVEENMRLAQMVLWDSDSAKLYDGTYNNQLGTSWKDTATSNIARPTTEFDKDVL